MVLVVLRRFTHQLSGNFAHSTNHMTSLKQEA